MEEVHGDEEEVKYMKRLHRKEGFTLVELMIVILIIAILVAIAVPVYLSARSRAQVNTCKANLRTIDGSVQQYSAMADGYPTGMANLTSGDYQVLKVAPECPVGAASYGFLNSGTANMTASCPNGHTYP